MPLVDGKTFYVQLGGATPERELSGIIPVAARRTGHLTFGRDEDGDLYLKLRPDVLFLDFKRAIEGARLLNRGLSFDYLTRPRSPSVPSSRRNGLRIHEVDSEALEQALACGGHDQVFTLPQGAPASHLNTVEPGQ